MAEPVSVGRGTQKVASIDGQRKAFSRRPEVAVRCTRVNAGVPVASSNYVVVFELPRKTVISQKGSAPSLVSRCVHTQYRVRTIKPAYPCCNATARIVGE
jgi:hypothetical protein